MTSLYSQWLAAKEAEKKAQESRRAIEASLLKQWGVTESETGTKTFTDDGYKVRVVFRMNQKIDADALREIAIEHGLESQLADLFRWKPEVNKKVWNAAASEITNPLLGAITNTPGAPSFSIEPLELY